MNLDDFRARFPEFRAAADELVQACLDEATLRIDSGVFGDLTDAAIGYVAADLVATSPLGKSQRLEDDEDETIYRKQYLKLRDAKVIRMTWT